MTRPRSSAPGRHRPARRSLPTLLLPLLAAALVAGCIGQDEIQDEPSATPVATAVLPTSSSPPSAETSPSSRPTSPATPAPTASEAATTPPASDGPSPSAGTGSAASCSGNDDNREFFSQAAAALDWQVYCAVLPERWFVAEGSYRTTGDGFLEIAYQGPGGARFELSQGAFCNDDDGCVPNGDDGGSAAFGDQSGTFVTADDGRLAVVVDRGAERSWLAIGVGLDADAFRGFAAGLLRVED